MDKKKLAVIIGIVVMSLCGLFFGEEFKKEVCGMESVVSK